MRFFWTGPGSPQSSPLLGSDPSSSSGLARKSKPFRASSVSGSSLRSEALDDGGFFLTIWNHQNPGLGHRNPALLTDPTRTDWTYGSQVQNGSVFGLAVLFLVFVAELGSGALNEPERLQDSSRVRQVRFTGGTGDPVSTETRFIGALKVLGILGSVSILT